MLVPASRTGRVIRRIARRLRRRPHIPRPATLREYAAEYVASLGAALDVLEGKSDPETSAGLRPVFLDPPGTAAEDFLVRDTGRPFRTDMRPLVETQRLLARTGAWQSFNAFMTIQPQLCLRISQWAHDYAARTALLAADSAPVQALPIGAWSLYALVTVNNMLCLHRLMRRGPDGAAPFERLFAFRFEAELSCLKRAVQAGMQLVTTGYGARRPGDMAFVRRMIPPLERLRQRTPPLPYLNGLRRASPLTLMEGLDDAGLWAGVSGKHLQGLEALLDAAAPFRFVPYVAQQWVDALDRTSGEQSCRIMDRIEMILDCLTPGAGVPAEGYAGERLRFAAGRACLVQFVRLALRAWPEWERRRGQAPIRRDILARIRRRVERAGRLVRQATGGQPMPAALTVSEYRRLLRYLARAGSDVPLIAS